jgi:hypothetical protein
MGNENSGNPEAWRNGEATQFGKPDGADPVAATYTAKANGNQDPWSIARSARYFAAQEIDADDPEPFKLRGKITRAERLGMRLLQKADEGSSRHLDSALDRVDGRVRRPHKAITDVGSRLSARVRAAA